MVLLQSSTPTLLLIAALLKVTVCLENMRVELLMQRYAHRHKHVNLVCSHNVDDNQVHKVEYLRENRKFFQYVRGRTPPYRNYSVPGAEINWENTTEKRVQLYKLDFSASGSYSCDVSIETPIYSRSSNPAELTIIQPQAHDPDVHFDERVYQIGEIFVANCTTAPARPPPHITWYINHGKVDNSKTVSLSNGKLYGANYMEQYTPSSSQLRIEVSALHIGKDGVLKLACRSTIPAYINRNNHERFADERKKAIDIDIVTPEPPTEATFSSSMASEATPAKAASFCIAIVLLSRLFSI